jgi:hypothetical protein
MLTLLFRQARCGTLDRGITLHADRIQTLAGGRHYLWSCLFGAAATKRRLRCILESQLHHLSELSPGDLCHDGKSQVDASRDSTARNDVAIAYNTLGAGLDAKLCQLITPCPMTGSSFTLQQTGRRQQQ